jgi:uncharacterized protein (TIGR04255 family)
MSAKQYARPPIEEALCEFTFAPLTPQFDFSLPGRLQLQSSMREYSGAPRTQNIQTIVTGANQPHVAFQNALFRIQLPTVDGTRMVALGANVLAVTVLRPYDGWSNFRPRIEQALAAYRNVTAVSPAVRIGLRYVNRIVVPHPDVKPASFLKGLPEETQIADSSLSSFMRRWESVRKDAIKVLVTQATLHATEPGTAEFLLDIDTLWDKESVLDNAEILHVVDQLHEIEGAAFEALITDEARSLFDAT